MALQIWCPFTSDTKQQGLGDISIPISASQGSIVTNGKLGKCLKTTATGNIETTYIPDLNNSNYSIGGWFKFNKSELQTALSNLDYTSIKTYAIGNLIGNNNYGGLGLCWESNDMYASSRVFNRLDIFGCLRTSSAGVQNVGTIIVDFDVWMHIFLVFDRIHKTLSLYKNGSLIQSKTITDFSDGVSRKLYINYGAVTAGNGPGACIPFYMNDFSIYDHALSAKEVEVLSRGLVCHYPLSDRSNQTPNNVAYNPTFNTDLASGGWNHWGISGSSGSYGQTTDKNYIFKKDQTYAHWFSNASTATGYYLVYQSPSFEGGFRSLCAILKEENGNPITGSIVCPSWNANTSGGTTFEKWTSITPLGNGFYLCKCEGIKQDGSNNLIGLKVNVGYKVYISECYIENDRTVCSDFFYPSTTVYDTSGYQNNGTTYRYDTNGLIECSADTARYSKCTYVNSSNNTENNITGTTFIYCDCKLTTPNYLTVAFWCKPIAGYAGGTGNGQFCTTSSDLNVYNAGADYATTAMHNRDGYIDMSTSTNVHKTLNISFTASEWHHYVIVYDGRYGKTYKDGILQSSTLDMGSTLSLASFNAVMLGYSRAGGVYRKNKSYYSDFRIYATALSAAQVAELYNTAVSVANNGTLMGYELVEG